jgi:hypothetical protein
VGGSTWVADQVPESPLELVGSDFLNHGHMYKKKNAIATTTHML